MAQASSSRRSSSPFKSSSRSPRKAASPSLQYSPVLDPDQLEREGGLLDEDESGFLDLASMGRGMEDLNLMESPMPRAIASSSSSARPRPSQARLSLRNTSPSKPKGRPSWGPKASPTKGKMRLLEGLDASNSSPNGNGHTTSSSTQKKERTLGALTSGRTAKGGPQKARQSIFARPTQSAPSQAKSRQSTDAGDDIGDDSFMKNPALATSTGSTSSVRERVASLERTKDASAALLAKATPQKSSKSINFDEQLAEVRRLNKVFDAYEQMLVQSADQVDDFTTRIGETNALLDNYIDLMRQTERTQQLLMDKDWKGVTEDEAMHALTLELAEREERRRREEAEEAARMAAQRAREAEQARLAAELVQQQQQKQIPRTTTATRGARASTAVRGSGLPTRGTVSARVRGASTASVRGRATAGSGATESTASSGLNNRYANVRSSGYGPR
ncbi:uncharacterized protein FA14DRAFT_188846 [Meira miltonrushii]|uniref:DASH complex subunit DUO1 n=1 Tax=Meira miltonrushii TaxID=1280837 RepID=A0A316VBA9_9BASI|nr:uncharacterized protein FA14DRAFT_188846 [Meira miltonrushii]PWN34796.1 hypothetical protein FA14DRAFT_188846 [Meira miltonrushii]